MGKQLLKLQRKIYRQDAAESDGYALADDAQLVELQRIRPELPFLYIDARNTRYVSWLIRGI